MPGYAVKVDEGKDIQVKKRLGGGAFGVAYRCNYRGDNPDAKALIAASGTKNIVVKKYIDKVDENELKIASHLYEASKSNPNPPKYCLALPLVDQTDKPIGLISQFVSYGKTDKGILSGDLETAIQKEVANNQSSVGSGLIFNFNLEDGLPLLTQSIFDSVDAVNRAGVLHCDIAARNFLMAAPTFDKTGTLTAVTAVLTDYGLSQSMPADITEGVTPLDLSKVPIRWYDSQSMATQKITAMTDIYATKATIIETMGLMLGVKVDNILSFKSAPTDPETLMDIAVKKRDNYTDNEALEKFLANVENAAAQCNDYRREAIQSYIASMRPFLTTMPSGSTLAELRDNDKALLSQCIKSYSEKLENTRSMLQFATTKPEELGEYTRQERSPTVTVPLPAAPEVKTTKDSEQALARERSNSIFASMPPASREKEKKNVTFAEMPENKKMQKMKSRAALPKIIKRKQSAHTPEAPAASSLLAAKSTAEKRDGMKKAFSRNALIISKERTPEARGEKAKTDAVQSIIQTEKAKIAQESKSKPAVTDDNKLKPK